MPDRIVKEVTRSVVRSDRRARVTPFVRGNGAGLMPATFDVGDSRSLAFTAPSLAFFLAAILLVLPSFALRADGSGAALYKAKCASCHGADGSGKTSVGKSLKVSDLCSKNVQKLSDKALAKVIADGKGKMPAYAKKLSADQIKSLVATVRALAK